MNNLTKFHLAPIPQESAHNIIIPNQPKKNLILELLKDDASNEKCEYRRDASISNKIGYRKGIKFDDDADADVDMIALI